MKEHPETALLMLCNPYNPVGEERINATGEGGGNATSGSSKSVVLVEAP